jgi:glycosyltransferase involved in cell wall biosynthesis
VRPRSCRASADDIGAVGRYVTNTAEQWEVTVVTPTTGEPELARCLRSVQEQTYRRVKHLVVVDGREHARIVSDVVLQFRDGDRQVDTLLVPENTGRGGFWGHRIYAACALLTNSDILMNLDSDNWYEREHVALCVSNMAKNGTDWTYSLRRVRGGDGTQLVEDDGDSLGAWPRYVTLLPGTVLSAAENRFNAVYPHLVDTSCYAIRAPLYVQTAPMWYFGYGADCIVATWLVRNHAVATTGRATVNYSLTSRKSPPIEWFIDGNRMMADVYGGVFPWRLPEIEAALGARQHPTAKRS